MGNFYIFYSQLWTLGIRHEHGLRRRNCRYGGSDIVVWCISGYWTKSMAACCPPRMELVVHGLSIDSIDLLKKNKVKKTATKKGHFGSISWEKCMCSAQVEPYLCTHLLLHSTHINIYVVCVCVLCVCGVCVCVCVCILGLNLRFMISDTNSQ